MPSLKRIKMATIAVPDVDAIAPLYEEWLGYTAVESGTVPDALAASWGAPNTGGRRYISMQPESGADVFIRAVEADHLDVIGHFSEPDTTPPHVDWIRTGSGFDLARFEATWTDIAHFIEL